MKTLSTSRLLGAALLLAPGLALAQPDAGNAPAAQNPPNQAPGGRGGNGGNGGPGGRGGFGRNLSEAQRQLLAEGERPERPRCGGPPGRQRRQREEQGMGSSTTKSGRRAARGRPLERLEGRNETRNLRSRRSLEPQGA